jgi:hypothetical protein
VLVNKLTVTAPQLSDAVGAVNDGAAVHSIVVFAPALPIVGATASVAENTCVHVLVQPFNVVTS